MRRLLAILSLGLLAFVLLAMAQEWGTFATAWFGVPPSAVKLGDEDRKAAADTVHEYLSLLAHAHAGEGDARYLDRLPASETVIEDLVADLRYLGRNRRRQVMILQRLEIQAVDQLDERSLEVHTREWWTISYSWAGSAAPAGKATANVIEGRFLVVREASGWTIQGADALDLAWGQADDHQAPAPG